MIRRIALIFGLLLTLAATASFVLLTPVVTEPVAGQARAVTTKPEPTSTPTPIPTPIQETAAPPVAVPTLTVPEVVPMAWAPGPLVPPGFDSVYEIIDPAAGYAGTAETLRLLLAHATSDSNPRGASPGNTWLALTPGDTVSVPWGAYTVSEAWDAAKPAYGAQPPLATDTWQDYRGALVMVTCVPLNDGTGRAATANRWVVAWPANL